MRSQSHNEFIEKWANFVRQNPLGVWKPQHTAFINAQFQMAERFYTQLDKEKLEKIKKNKMQ